MYIVYYKLFSLWLYVQSVRHNYEELIIVNYNRGSVDKQTIMGNYFGVMDVPYWCCCCACQVSAELWWVWLVWCDMLAREYRGFMLLLHQNCFQYNNNYYQPTQGIVMGSPLSSTLAKIHLQYFEELTNTGLK